MQTGVLVGTFLLKLKSMTTFSPAEKVFSLWVITREDLAAKFRALLPPGQKKCNNFFMIIMNI
jgi:hypothetical protein